MSHSKATTYQERERRWREFASRLLPGADRDACLTLAEGYANLLAILERLDVPQEDSLA
jgi:hypothetical protein